MRTVSDRFSALIPYPNQWVTEVSWSNDGWATSNAATFVDGTVVCSQLDQIRWSTQDLTLAEVPLGLTGINAYSTQIAIRHGLPGELLPFGLYKVTYATRDGRTRVKVKASSLEISLIKAAFVSTRALPAQPASKLAAYLIREVLPGAPVAWECDDTDLPKLTVAQDRWGTIDGDRNSTSIAKAVGARIYAGPAGNWIARPVPTLTDDPVWEAAEGDGGVLISHGEELSADEVYNTIVVSGQSTNTDYPPFKNGIAQDLEPSSPTYVKKPVTSGGFGLSVKFYSSEMITSHAKAQAAAEAMLAPCLGLRQQVTFTQVHDPRLEPGDVGLVHTIDGPRRVLLDELTYSLTGQPMQAKTRTTATTLVGDSYVPPDDQESA